EESIRYKEMLPAELSTRASELTLGQLVALRFAGNEELSELLRRTCDQEFATAKEIKQAVKNWRGDYHRV
ncbi:MAG: DUF6526 family protein, partial [Pyrinomonadaceae bacterium]